MSWRSIAELNQASLEASTSGTASHSTVQDDTEPEVARQQVAEAPSLPRQNSAGNGRARGQWGWRKNRNRNRYQPYGTRPVERGDAGDRDEPAPTDETPVQLAPLSAAKGVIKQKLSVMFRGLRGIEAAQAAFDMCGVEIGFQVNERTREPPSENAGRGRGRNIRGRFGKPRGGPNSTHTRPDPMGDSQD